MNEKPRHRWAERIFDWVLFAAVFLVTHRFLPDNASASHTFVFIVVVSLAFAALNIGFDYVLKKKMGRRA